MRLLKRFLRVWLGAMIGIVIGFRLSEVIRPGFRSPFFSDWVGMVEVVLVSAIMLLIIWRSFGVPGLEPEEELDQKEHQPGRGAE